MQEKFASYNAAEIIKDGDSANLSEVSKEIADIITWANDYFSSPDFQAQLPDNIRRSIENEMETVARQLDEILELRQGKPHELISQKQSRIDTVKNLYSTLYRELRERYMTYVVFAGGDEKIRQLDAHITRATEAEEEAKKAEAAQRAAATKTAVGTLGNYFSEEATKYNTVANQWLFAVAGSVLTTLLVSYFLFGGTNIAHDVRDIRWESVLAKGIVVAAVAYSIRFCVRNYSASRHLGSVNSHNAVVMKTLLGLFQEVKDVEGAAKEVISVAAQETFKFGESGYLTKHEGAGDGNTIVGQILKGKS